MKKLILILILFVLIMNFYTNVIDNNKPITKQYVLDNCIVVKAMANGCQFEDTNGHKWSILYDKNDVPFYVGEVVTLTMHNKGTEFVKDDSIINVERVVK